MTTLTLSPTAQAFVIRPQSVAELLELETLLENVRAARELWPDAVGKAALTDIEREILRHI
jgi:hypothetical protein